MNFEFSMRFPFKEVGQTKVTLSDLVTIESSLGIYLPEDYRQFLLAWNGALIPDERIAKFPLRDSVDEFDFGYFGVLFGIRAGSSWDIRKQYGNYQFPERVPIGFLPIGAANDWDRVVIDSSNSSVYFWQPGEPTYEEGYERTLKYLRPVADSFVDFWYLIEDAPTSDLHS
jgi:SMI1 / KNR4 family (SUKH-1)